MDTQAKRGRKSASPKSTKTYQVPKGEEGHVHARIRQGGFNPNTGKPLNKPIVQKWNIDDWNTNFSQHGRAQGWHLLEILHAPDGVNDFADHTKVTKERRKEALLAKMAELKEAYDKL